jgi:hypothetical protein
MRLVKKDFSIYIAGLLATFSKAEFFGILLERSFLLKAFHRKGSILQIFLALKCGRLGGVLLLTISK